MPDGERKRPGPGPPPLLSLLRPLAGPPHLQPHCMLLDVHGMHRLLSIAESGSAKSINPFIYNPFRPVRSRQLPAGAIAPACASNLVMKGAQNRGVSQCSRHDTCAGEGQG